MSLQYCIFGVRIYDFGFMEKANTDSRDTALRVLTISKQIKEIKATQERILAIVEDAFCPTTSSDFERNQLIAQHGGDVLAALKEHNKRQKRKQCAT